jgi:epoxyqueuosine reductase
MKTEYQKLLDGILQDRAHEIEQTGKKKTLLLHACCGPCSSYVLEYLVPFFNITVYYYNPNIFPPEEYSRRLDELQKFLMKFPAAQQNGVQLFTDNYAPEEYYIATGTRTEPELGKEPERGERCRRCYGFRMKKAYEYAAAHQFDWFTTTLSISPFKDAVKINTIGKQLEAAYTAENGKTGPLFLTSDFKKRNGFLRSLELSAQYHLYRQQYCGCEFSLRNTPHVN